MVNMSDRFEVQAMHVGSGVIRDGDEQNDVYKLLNIQVRIYYPPQANLMAKYPTTEEIAAELAKVIEKTSTEINFYKPKEDTKKIKSPCAFRGGEEIATENEFGWHKVYSKYTPENLLEQDG
jgi:hypothetical protein